MNNLEIRGRKFKFSLKLFKIHLEEKKHCKSSGMTTWGMHNSISHKTIISFKNTYYKTQTFEIIGSCPKSIKQMKKEICKNARNTIKS
jgi:hypothetical protein